MAGAPVFHANAVFTYFTALIDERLLPAADAIMGRGLAQADLLLVSFGAIAFAFYGLAIASGRVQAPAIGFGVLLAKFAFSSAILSTAAYSYWVRDAVVTAMPAFWLGLVSDGATGAGGAAAYDAVWNQALAGGLAVWRELSTLNPFKFVILAFWAAALFAVLAGYGVFLLAHIMAVLYVAFGPVFVPLALFATTRPIFSAWIGSTLSTVVLQGLSVALTTLLIAAETGIVREMLAGSSDFGTRVALVGAAVAVFGLCGWWARKLPAAAASLCGGVHFAPNVLMNATYGLVSQGARRVLGATGRAAARQGRAAGRRIANAAGFGPSAPPGPSLSRSQSAPVSAP